MRTLKIRPTQPQADYHAMQCKYPAFVGGFGTGKSETMANQAIMDASHSSSALIGLYEPTYDLVRLIMAPRIQEKLIDYGIRFKYNKSENIIYTGNSQFGDFILRTLDNPERIVGYETYRSHVDELDTLNKEKAQAAWIKIIARNRQSPDDIDDCHKLWNEKKQRLSVFNRVGAYCTPEGFKFMYDRWVMNESEHYKIIQASTLSNPFLPDDYVDTLRASYPSQLIEAYINGEFVNLTSGTVYRSFSRSEHNTNAVIESGEPLYIGQDFNVDHMASTIYVRRNGVFYGVDEIYDGFDTAETIGIIKSRYEGHTIYIYPDASGNNRKSNNASESDIQMLRNAGFTVMVNNTNPAVKDRVIAVNTALEKGQLFINSDKCPETVRCLEQQVYDKNGEPDKKSGDDHQNDATGYPIAYELPIIKPFFGSINNWNTQ